MDPASLNPARAVAIDYLFKYGNCVAIPKPLATIEILSYSSMATLVP